MGETRTLAATMRVYILQGDDPEDFSFDFEMDDPDGMSTMHLPRSLAMVISKWIGPLLPLLNQHMIRVPDDASEAGG